MESSLNRASSHWLTVVALLCLGACAHPRVTPTPAIARDLKTWSVVPVAISEESLTPGEEREWTLDVPAYRTLILCIEARVDWPQLAGLAYLMELRINARPVSGDALMNKRESFTFADGRSFHYYGWVPEYTPDERPSWGVFYSPNYDANNHLRKEEGEGHSARYLVQEGDAYLYMFDVTELPTEGALHLTLLNSGAGYAKALGTPVQLRYRQLKLLVLG